MKRANEEEQHGTPSKQHRTGVDSPSSSQTESVSMQFFSLDGPLGLDNIFISISGLIGAGKTTLCTALANKLKIPAYFEPVIENEYLDDFYRDMKRYSFSLQIYLLNKRFAQQQQIIWQGKGGVQDRTLYEDCVFAKVLYRSGLMEERDYRTYCQLFTHITNFCKKPNLIVHLDVTPEESLERIKKRNRASEAGISIDYLKNLQNAYEEYIKEISRVCPVIRVNWSEFKTVEEMAERIRVVYSKMHIISYIDWKDNKNSTENYWECVIRGFDCFAVQKKQSMFHFSFKLMLTRVGGVLLRGSGNLIKKSNSSVQTINKSLITAKNSQPLNQFKFMSESANKKQKLMSTRTVISSPDAPKAIGPYSQAIKATGSFVFVSGQIPLDPKTGELVVGGIDVQTEQVLKNIETILKASGSSFEKVVKVTVLLQNISDWPAVNVVYAKYFKDNYPARAAYAVAALPKGASIEIEVTALSD